MQRKFPLLKPITLGLSVSFIALTHTGCSYLEPYKSGIAQGNILTTENVDLIQEGLTKGQVRQLIGPPMGENPFNPNRWEYVFYTTHDNDNLSEVNEHLVIEFDQNNMVSRWFSKDLNIALEKEDKFLGLF